MISSSYHSNETRYNSMENNTEYDPYLWDEFINYGQQSDSGAITDPDANLLWTEDDLNFLFHSQQTPISDSPYTALPLFEPSGEVKGCDEGLDIGAQASPGFFGFSINNEESIAHADANLDMDLESEAVMDHHWSNPFLATETPTESTSLTPNPSQSNDFFTPQDSGQTPAVDGPHYSCSVCKKKFFTVGGRE